MGGLITDILGAYFREDLFQAAAEAVLPLTALVNAVARVHNWPSRAHLGNAPVLPILLNACKHLDDAGMPPADHLRQAITEHGLGVTFGGGSVANPLPRPLKLVQAYMGHLERTAGDPPYPGAVAAAKHHSSAVLQHRSPAKGYFLVARGRTGQEQQRGGGPARSGCTFAMWALTAAQ